MLLGERPVVVQGQGCDCKDVKLWIRFPLEEIKYLIFPFLCSFNDKILKYNNITTYHYSN